MNNEINRRDFYEAECSKYYDGKCNTEFGQYCFLLQQLPRIPKMF